MTPVEASVHTDSAAARQRGNELYRAGKLAQGLHSQSKSRTTQELELTMITAEKAYEEALRLDPQDAAPLTNLSALKFELGQYDLSVQRIEQALSLPVAALDVEKQQKLYARWTKCQLNLLSIKAQDHLDQLAEDGASQTLKESVQETYQLWKAVPATTAHRKRTLDRLPCLKSYMYGSSNETVRLNTITDAKSAVRIAPSTTPWDTTRLSLWRAMS